MKHGVKAKHSSTAEIIINFLFYTQRIVRRFFVVVVVVIGNPCTSTNINKRMSNATVVIG